MMAAPRVLVVPRDPNPYQELLYSQIERDGWVVEYGDGPTGSRTLNVLLKPVVLVWYRAKGFRLLHLHWVYDFSLPWGNESRIVQRFLQQWFSVYLAVARGLGFHIVWTAHNVLPHAPVFRDDVAARRELIEHSDAVIALSSSSVESLDELGARDVRVIPFGSYGSLYSTAATRAEARSSLGIEPDDRVALLLGRIEPYKGADALLEAVAALDSESPLRTIVAGECANVHHREELVALGRRAGTRATVTARRLTDDEMAQHLVAADVAVFPFRAVTNSSSVLLALSSGLPVVIPDLEALSVFPDAVAIRYDRSDPGALVAALEQISSLSDRELERMSAAARSFAASVDWSSVSRATEDLYVEVLNQ